MTPIAERRIWPAPAKINLFLHVTGRRSDGYHLLQTVFQIVDLADVIAVEVTHDGAISRSGGLPGLAAEADLVVRAARLLQRETGCALGACIDVDKRIPAGAGLGGGSSDAATTLVALNEMWALGLDVDRLAALGLSLGADVPIFVRGRTAWAEGIGEALTPIDTPSRWYVVVFPDESVPTAGIFADPALTRDTLPTTIPRFLSGEPTRNDLQAVVVARHPRVASALEWLSGSAPARMSGSGASVFAAFAGRAQAEMVAQRCPAEWKVFVTRGLLRSPLLDAVAALRGEAGQS
jgi:4-diphosphocytidyl-2-C-methyl-D-erythritol kinase